jgi:hypothetical protein
MDLAAGQAFGQGTAQMKEPPRRRRPSPRRDARITIEQMRRPTDELPDQLFNSAELVRKR